MILLPTRSLGLLIASQIERRIAPFWRGLNDHSDSWTENQLVAAARALPIPAPDEIPDQEEPKTSSQAESERQMPDKNINNLTVAMSSRTQSFNSDTSSNLSPLQPSFPPGPGTSSDPASSSGSALFRGRAKTLASLTTSAKNPQADITPREMQLPKDPYVNGQSIEAYLYKDASECPICFLFYPPYLNKTRCCDQAICSECFVQIKRPDPHVPEHADPTAPPREGAELIDPEELISEPAACPFCVQPEFGITYDPPPFRRGLTYVNHPSTHPLANSSSAMSSESSLGSAMSNGGRMSPSNISRRRTTSISATSPLVITTDRVRPDWHQKLATARAHTARRSAAATALHTAAYLMGNRGHEGEGRALGPFGRRGLLRRTSGPDISSGSGVSQLNMLALMSERYASSSTARGEEGEPSMTPGPRGSSRRNRVDDLEDMMMMEAIRLSLASEEERRKKEEKDAKKDAKKKEKENKKAEKVARKTGIYPSSANQSTGGIDSALSSDASTSQGDLSISGKGKSTQPINPFEQSSYTGLLPSSSADPQEHLERARAQILPNDPGPFSSPYSSPPYRPSHLRTLSNASSSASSIDGSRPGSLKSDLRGQGSSFEVSPSASGINIPSAGSAQDTYISGTPPGGGAGLEPMFNFRSLAAMVGDDDRMKDGSSEENMDDGQAPNHQEGESFGKLATADERDQSTATATPGEPTLQMNDPATETSNVSNIDVPSFKITASSRTNSDFDDTKHAAMVDENISRNDVHTS